MNIGISIAYTQCYSYGIISQYKVAHQNDVCFLYM